MNDTTTPEDRLAALKAKLAIIDSGQTAIMPTGEIVPRGTPGSRDYDPPKPVFQNIAEKRFWELQGHPGDNWTYRQIHHYNAEKAAFVLGWREAQKAAPPGLIPPADSPPEPAMRWIPRDEHPEAPGWYYVKRLDGTIGNRFFDDANGGMWLHCNAVNGYTQNHHFADWLHIPMIHTPYPRPATAAEAMHAMKLTTEQLTAALARAEADESQDGIRAAAIFRKEIQRKRGPRPNQPEPEHKADCDTNDHNPEGIRKPCNCKSAPEPPKFGFSIGDRVRYHTTDHHHLRGTGIVTGFTAVKVRVEVDHNEALYIPTNLLKVPEPADSPTLTDIALKIQGAIATMRNRPTMAEQAEARRQLDAASADLNKRIEGGPRGREDD